MRLSLTTYCRTLSVCAASGLPLLCLLACGDTNPAAPTFGEVRTFGDHREIDVVFSSQGDRLSGTLYFPLSTGPFAAAVENPGSAWTTRSTWAEVAPFVAGFDVAMLSYDKRGSGQSQGTCCPGDPTATFQLLADDVVAAAHALTDRSDVRINQIGTFGSSQGGWIVPVAANEAPDLIAFVIVAVGGAVSTGQENLYDRLTGYDVCSPTNTPLSEITEQLRAAGTSGFDPRTSLEQLSQPAIWLYGEEDRSHPTQLAVENLEAIRNTFIKDWTIVVLPGANHDLIENGTICQTDGLLADVFTPLSSWLSRVLGGN